MKPPLLSFRALLQTDKKTFVERMPPTAHHETQLYKRAHTLFEIISLYDLQPGSLVVLHPLFLFLMDPSSSWQVLFWSLIFKLISDPGSKIRFKILTGICLAEIKQIKSISNKTVIGLQTSLIISLIYAIHIIWPCTQCSVVIFCQKISLA